MRRPVAPRKRDMTDKYMRRCLRVLGFKPRGLPWAVTDLVEHPSKPGEYEVMLRDGERREDAVLRLRKWAMGF